LVDSIFERITDPIVIHGQQETIKGLKEHIFNWTIWPDFSRLPQEDRPVMRYQVERVGGDRERLDEGEVDGGFGDAGDAGEPEGGAVGEFVELAGSGAEDAGEMMGGVAAKGGGGGVEVVDEEAAAHGGGS
jgi:hypothetical protein